MWEGHPTPEKMTSSERSYSLTIWKLIMQEYIQGQEKKDYNFDSNVITKQYCAVTGKLADSEKCTETLTGYYTSGNMPDTCDGVHDRNPSDTSSVEPMEPAESAVSSKPESSSSESSNLESSSEPESIPSSDGSSENTSSDTGSSEPEEPESQPENGE